MNPIRVLNVAEKPYVARAVSEILARSAGGDPLYDVNRSTFEFNYTIKDQPCRMVFTSVDGHLLELAFVENWMSHSAPLLLAEASVYRRTREGKETIISALQEEALQCKTLILWLDCDREGESIAYEVRDVCLGVNRELQVWRARFSAFTDREILESVQNLVSLDKKLADAVAFRREFDLRIGCAFTMLQTDLLKSYLGPSTTGRDVLLSFGSCQLPTLGFIVEQYWVMKAHMASELWTINCTHTSEKGITTFSWTRKGFPDQASARNIYQACKKESAAIVKEVREEKKVKRPPFPLNALELQKRASRYLRMSSTNTMKVAEDLYLSGFISYPRTRTDNFSVNTNLRAIVEAQVDHPVWGSYAGKLLTVDGQLWSTPRNGGHYDEAHPPIHPTKFSLNGPWRSEDHRKLYGLVVRHFLACVSKHAVGVETTVEIDIAGERFSASGRVILEKNYLEVYIFESWKELIIPTYTTGQQFLPNLTLDSGITRAPSPLSEADLLGAMDKAGIGTDATMHGHIKTLLERDYVQQDSNMCFSPKKLGLALVNGYKSIGYELWKPNLRSLVESDMHAVSTGSMNKAEALESHLHLFKNIFLDVRRHGWKFWDAFAMLHDGPGVDTPPIKERVRLCDLCNESNMVLERKPNDDFMVVCLGYPACENVVSLPRSIISEAVVSSQVCDICTPGIVSKIQFKFRRMEGPDADHLGCIGGCDATLKEQLEIRGTGSPNHAGTSAQND